MGQACSCADQVPGDLHQHEEPTETSATLFSPANRDVKEAGSTEATVNFAESKPLDGAEKLATVASSAGLSSGTSAASTAEPGGSETSPSSSGGRCRSAANVDVDDDAGAGAGEAANKARAKAGAGGAGEPAVAADPGPSAADAAGAARARPSRRRALAGALCGGGCASRGKAASPTRRAPAAAEEAKAPSSSQQRREEQRPQPPPQAPQPQEEQRSAQLPLVAVPGGAEADGKAAPTTAEALASCRDRLSIGDVLGAERALIEALFSFEEVGALSGVAEIRASSEYAETLELLRRVFGPSAASSPSSGGDCEKEWRLGAEVKVDPQALGYPKQTGELADLEYVVKIFYRTHGKKVEVRIECELGTPDGGPITPEQVLLGWTAMLEEMSLWESWHPIVAKGGAVPAGEQSKYRKMWFVPVSFFFKKEVSLEETFMLFDHETGTFTMFTEGQPPDSAPWKEHKQPSGYTPTPMVIKTNVTVKPRRDATSFQIQIEATAPFTVPDMLIKWATSWLLPEVTKRMLKAAAKCASGTGPHAERLDADRLGTYAECKRLVESGVSLDQDDSSAKHREQERMRRSLLIYDSMQSSLTGSGGL